MSLRRTSMVMAAGLTVVLALAGCGRKGPLEPPPGVPQTQAPAAAEARQSRVFGNPDASTANGLIQSPDNVYEETAAAKLNSATQGTPPRPINGPTAARTSTFLLDPLLH